MFVVSECSEGMSIYDNVLLEDKRTMNYTYIVQCSDDTFYTGWTNDLEGRLQAHNEGRGAKYTRPRRPVRLIYYEEFASKQEAMSREYAIKHMTRRQKEKLCGGFCSLGSLAAGKQ